MKRILALWLLILMVSGCTGDLIVPDEAGDTKEPDDAITLADFERTISIIWSDSGVEVTGDEN